MGTHEEARKNKLAYKEMLASQCSRVLEMKEFMEMISHGKDVAEGEAFSTTGQISDRHLGAAKALRDLLRDIRIMAEWTPAAAEANDQKGRLNYG